MTYTYDLNEGGNLVISASPQEQKWLEELRGPVGEYGETKRPYSEIEWDALEGLICNSDLDFVAPEEIGALTAAPILGIREDDGNGGARVVAAWGFMCYAMRSFVDDLIDTGKAVFTS